MQNARETSSAEMMAAETINAVTESEANSAVAPSVLATRIELAAALLPEDAQPLVSEHVAGLRNLESDVVIEPLDAGVGGQYDGSVSIATDTILVDQSGIGETVERMAEVDAHEAYHRDHGHLDPLATVESQEGNTVVTIGGRGFDRTALTEAVTVIETGQEFVSEGYKKYVRDLQDAVAVSSVTYAQIRDALNKRNLVDVDDATIAKRDERNPVLAA